MTIRVGVLGAGGRMGREVCRAVRAAEGLRLEVAVDPHNAGDTVEGVYVRSSHAELGPDDVDVMVDFTHPSAVYANVCDLLDAGIHVVVGTTGMTDEQLEDVSARADASSANAFVAPNFAIGAVLMMHVSQVIARYLPHVEITELHHDGKADAPSGTALRTADLIASAREEAPAPVMGEVIDGARGADRAGIRVHSVRLPGLVAHQEVLFGGEGQTLSIRHDSIDRSSFMPGVILAVRRVADAPGLTVGLEALLDL